MVSISFLQCEVMSQRNIKQNWEMEHMPKNGYFFERRKMFVDAPFHNMFSNVPLNWKEENSMTEEAQRHLRRQQEERERMKKAYEMSVEERTNKRFTNFDHSNPENDKFNRKAQDVLAKQLEMFNRSKVLMTHELPESRLNNTKETISHEEPHPKPDNPKEHQSLYNETSPKPEHQQQQRYDNSPEMTSRHSHRELQSSTINYQLPPEHPEHQGYQQSRSRQYSPASDRYRSLEGPDRYRSIEGPYLRRDLGKQIEELYTGSKPADYPFRNVKPDQLQNFLRQKTKADRKRTYQVSLNLFKK